MRIIQKQYNKKRKCYGHCDMNPDGFVEYRQWCVSQWRWCRFEPLEESKFEKKKK